MQAWFVVKTNAHRKAQTRQGQYEVSLQAAAAAIFRRCPTLCGFAIRDGAKLPRDRHTLQHSSGLFVTEISVFPFISLEAPVEIRNEIVAELSTLIDECPEASALLGDRTFARVLH